MEVVDQLRNDLELSKKKRDELIPNWQLNVEERRGKSADTAADDNRSMVPMDWTLTKTKSAQLFSQIPQVRLIAKHQAFEQAVPVAAKIVNDLIAAANVGAVVTECVIDCVNAAGVGAAIVRYESLTESVSVPAVDPLSLQMQQMMTLPRNSIPMRGGKRRLLWKTPRARCRRCRPSARRIVGSAWTGSRRPICCGRFTSGCQTGTSARGLGTRRAARGRRSSGC